MLHTANDKKLLK